MPNPSLAAVSFSLQTICELLLTMLVAWRIESSEDALSKARKYTWKVNDKFVIDPTNSEGEVEEKIKYLGGLYSVSSSLAYINEPTIKEDCNIRIEIEDEYPDRIKFISNRIIYPNGKDLH